MYALPMYCESCYCTSKVWCMKVLYHCCGWIQNGYMAAWCNRDWIGNWSVIGAIALKLLHGKHEKILIFRKGTLEGCLYIAKTTRLPMLFCKTRTVPYTMQEELHVSWLRVDEGCSYIRTVHRSSGALANCVGNSYWSDKMTSKK